MMGTFAGCDFFLYRAGAYRRALLWHAAVFVNDFLWYQKTGPCSTWFGLWLFMTRWNCTQTYQTDLKLWVPSYSDVERRSESLCRGILPYLRCPVTGVNKKHNPVLHSASPLSAWMVVKTGRFSGALFDVARLNKNQFGIINVPICRNIFYFCWLTHHFELNLMLRLSNKNTCVLCYGYYLLNPQFSMIEYHPTFPEHQQLYRSWPTPPSWVLAATLCNGNRHHVVLLGEEILLGGSPQLGSLL